MNFALTELLWGAWRSVYTIKLVLEGDSIFCAICWIDMIMTHHLFVPVTIDILLVMVSCISSPSFRIHANDLVEDCLVPIILEF